MPCAPRIWNWVQDKPIERLRHVFGDLKKKKYGAAQCSRLVFFTGKTNEFIELVVESFDECVFYFTGNTNENEFIES